MMKRALSFVLCLVMVLSFAAPSVQAAGTDDVYTTDNIMDNIMIEDGANVDVVVDGEIINKPQDTKLPNPADLVTKETEPSAPMVSEEPAEVPALKQSCECTNLDSAEEHLGVCLVKAPYMQACEATAEELYALWGIYTPAEQVFMLSYLEDAFPLKHFELQKLLSAPTGTASEILTDGTTVTVEGIPQDGSLTVGEATDAVKDIVDAHVAEQEETLSPLFGYDVSVQDGEGIDWQPDTNVKLELELPGQKLHKNTQVFVVHVDDEGNATTIEATVTEDGKIAFETPGFSAFYGFTVDFHYEDATFSIPGMSSVKLSELFEELKMPLDASDVVALEYTDDTQLKIEQLEGDWLLTSLKAFSTEEKLTMTLADGSVYQIKVTDLEVMAGTYTWHIYNGYYGNYNHIYCADRFPYGDGYAAGTGDNSIFNGTFSYTTNNATGNTYWWDTTADSPPKQLFFDDVGQVTTVNLLPKTNKAVLVMDMIQEFCVWNSNVTIQVDPSYTGVTKEIIIRPAVADDEEKPLFSVINCNLTIKGSANTKITLDYSGSNGKARNTLYPLIWENGTHEKNANTNTKRSLTLENVTFRNSVHSGVDLYQSQMTNITLKNCVFENTVSNTSDGGQFRIRDTGLAVMTLSVSNCSFTGTTSKNTSANRGGAISVEKGVTTVTFTDCTFTDISGGGHGGAICLNKANDNAIAMNTATFTRCTFTRCKAKNGRGGAIRAIASHLTPLTLDNCRFEGCSATSHGGAVSWQGKIGNITVNNGTTFSNCTAANRGGGLSICCSNIGNITLNGASFTGNTAGTLGGGAQFGLDGATAPITAGTVSVTNCTFEDNMAHGVGGGLCLSDGQYQSVSVTSTTFNRCKTTGYGGALGMKVESDGGKAEFSVVGDVRIIGCTFQNCLAGNLTLNAYVNAETHEGVKTWDHDNDPSTPEIDKLNGASGAGAIILGGTIGGKVLIQGTDKNNPMLFENCLSWNNAGAIFFTSDLDVAGTKDASGKVTEAVTLKYLNINKCFARDGGSAVYLSSTIIPLLKTEECIFQNCGYFDKSDPNFPDSLVTISNEWFSTPTVYKYVLDSNGNKVLDANGKPKVEVDNEKTAQTKTTLLARWTSYPKEQLYLGADYGGTFRTTGGTGCVAQIINCEFANNRSYGNGGAIYWNANRDVYSDPDTKLNPIFRTSLTISNTPIHGNYAKIYGGGLFCEGTVTIESCDIYENTSLQRGGGIAQNVYSNSARQLGESGSNESTTLVLKAATGGQPVKIYNNNAQYGGGIAITAAMTDSYPHTVKANVSSADSGKPENWIFKTDFTYEVKFRLGGTHVYGNQASQDGGGIFYDTVYYLDRTDTPDDNVPWTERQRQVDSYIKDILIDDGLIYGNTAGYGATTSKAGGDGGGVYMNSNQINTSANIPSGQKTGSSTVNITGGSIYDNHAISGNGGGIYMQGTNAVCTVTGGVIGATSQKTTVNGVTIMRPNQSMPNTAVRATVNGTSIGGNGGGIAVFGGVRIEMDGGYVVNNTCNVAGGGIAVHDESSMLFTDGTVKNNRANMGGGISLNKAKPLNSQSKLDAEKYAMFMNGGIVKDNKITPQTMSQNVYGGGVCISGQSTMKISNGEISNNTATNKDLSSYGQYQEGGGVAVCEGSNMIIDGGKIFDNKAYHGGGVVVRGISSVTMNGTLTVDKNDNVTYHDGSIYNNFAKQYGGGVYIYEGDASDPNNIKRNTFEMNGGYIYNNEADYDKTNKTGFGQGGGIYLRRWGKFVLNDGRVDGNYCYDGGGIHGLEGCIIIINDGVMKGNYSGRHGGAIYNDYGKVEINGGRFVDNYTRYNGGAIFNYGLDGKRFDFDVNGGAFTNNIAQSGYGGAICAEGGTKSDGSHCANVGDVDISSGTFIGNAAKYGGGILVSKANVGLTGGNFKNNISNQGGALYLTSCQDVTISNIRVLENHCRADSRIDSLSPKLGGGLYIESQYQPCSVTIDTGEFSGNTAPTAGGIIVYNGKKNVDYPATLVINGGTIHANKALEGSGGGIYVYGGDVSSETKKTSLTLNGGTISKNVAQGNGGGVFAHGQGAVLITVGTVNGQPTKGVITENTANNGGGIYVTTGAALTVIGGYITYNKAISPANATDIKTGYHQSTNLHGSGGGICVTKGETNAVSTFTLRAPENSNDMAIYGNEADYCADDVFSSGEKTKLDVPTVKQMNLVGYGYMPEGWVEDYNPKDNNYGNSYALNMYKANGAPNTVTIQRYRSANAAQRRYSLIMPDLKGANGNILNYVRGNEDKPNEATASYNYVNKADAYVAMTLGIPAAMDDTIVIDYGSRVIIDVWQNDLFMNQDDFKQTKVTVNGTETVINHSYVGKTIPNVLEKDGVRYSTTAPTTGVYAGSYTGNMHGKASNKLDGRITFIPNTMMPNKADTFFYTVEHRGIWYYANVTVIPATTVYYEDNITSIKYHGPSDSKLESLATWETIGESENPYQNQDRPGPSVIEGVDEDNIYGYDTHYKGEPAFSYGSAHKVTVSRVLHQDTNGDNKCEFCGGATKHSKTDANNDGRCDTCNMAGCHGLCKDQNKDNYCDKCGNIIEHECIDRAAPMFYCDLCGRAAGTHTQAARASFTFTGTGFDIISYCDKSTGIVMATVYTGEVLDFDTPPYDRYVASYMVDTHYGYTYNATGDKWVYDENSTGKLYQVPVIKADLTKVVDAVTDKNNDGVLEYTYKNWGYGTYTVELYIAPSFLEREPGYWGADFYLDAIRIYNPANVDGTYNYKYYAVKKDSNKNPVYDANGNPVYEQKTVNNTSSAILDAYKADKEGWPVYTELRNLILKRESLSVDGTAGVVFIDGGKIVDKDATLSDYQFWGPNNEVYLAAGKSIAFYLDSATYGANVASVQLGLKGLEATGQAQIFTRSPGNTTTTRIWGKTIGTTDMYYNISRGVDKVVVVTNVGTTPIAVTNLKVTHTQAPGSGSNTKKLIRSSTRTAEIALEILNSDDLVENPVVTPKRPALSFNGMVCYNVFFSAENLGDLTGADLGLAVFSTEDTEGTIETAREVIYGATEIDGLYMSATSGIHAKNLGDRQYFRVFAKKSDGSIVYSKMVSYSALDYAKNVLAKSEDAKLKQLVVAMLNYGAEAQKFFGYNTDDLMNKDLTADDQALLAGFHAGSLNTVGKVDASKVGSFVSNGGFSQKKPAISFKGAFEINYFFTPANTVDGDMTLYFWNEDTYNSVSELTAENADKSVTMTLEDGTYTATSDEIAAKYLDRTVYVAAVYESNGVRYCSGVLPYSIAAYCQKPPATVQDLATAAAIYGCTAKLYFGV